MILREATPADVPALSRLAIESFNAKFAHLYSAKDLADFLEENLSEPAIAAELANPDRVYRLAEDAEGTLLGYCKIGLACGFPDHARGQRVMELKQLYTAPEATGQGIGGESGEAEEGEKEQEQAFHKSYGSHGTHMTYESKSVPGVTCRSRPWPCRSRRCGRWPRGGRG